jgi:lipid-A-disaccharide synthase
MPESPVTIGVVAGEASGDQLGAHLINAVRARLPNARFAGIGGPRMQSAGMEVLYPMEKLAVRGYVEVLRHFFEIVGIRRRLTRQFLAQPPALFVGIDAPDFNLGLEARLRAAGIPTAHLVSPQIWAWRAGRIDIIRRAVDRMLVVFPFEEALYREADVPVTYVGHPVAEILGRVSDRAGAREQLRLPLTAKVIALLPGSRVSEIEQLAELFLDTAELIAAGVPDARFLVPLTNRPTREMFEAALYRRDRGELNVTVLFGHAHEAMAAADVVLAAAGTATLEAALLGRPVVIAYRMPRASWWIMSCYRHQAYVGLPNILAGEFVVPEFLQDEATPENLSQALLNVLFDNTVKARLETRFAALARELRQNSAERIAGALLPLLRSDARR